jgi:hypothetical protein
LGRFVDVLIKEFNHKVHKDGRHKALCLNKKTLWPLC